MMMNVDRNSCDVRYLEEKHTTPYRVGWIILDKMFVGSWLLDWEFFRVAKTP